MNNNVHPITKDSKSFTFAGSGEPPYGGDMELSTRVGNLEADMKDVRERTIRIESRLDHMDSKMDKIDREVHQTKWWIIGSMAGTILAVIGTVVGTGIGIQQMTVTTFQAAAQQAAPAQQPAPIIIQIPTQDKTEK